MVYHLTLPKGVITENRGVFVGSKTHGIWSPFAPGSKSAPKGWQAGDKLVVTCTFNLYPNTTDLPKAKDYYGLSVAAINNPTPAEVKKVEGNMKRRSAGTTGQGVTTSTTPNDQSIFYNAVPEKATFALQPASRGIINNIVYHWTMDYNAAYPGVNPTDIEIIFGYGDPMIDEEIT